MAKRVTKAELQKEYEALQEAYYALKQESLDRKAAEDASGLFGYGGTSKEPETEVGYLRRELAYARGQLHMAHSTVKELCRKASTPIHIPPHPLDEQTKFLLDRMASLLEKWEELAADGVNVRDLCTAGIEPKKPWNQVVNETIKDYVKKQEREILSARKRVCDP